MTPIDWAVRPLKRYADFSGRAPRAEYWWYSLFASVLRLIVVAIDRFTFDSIYGGQGPLGLLLLVALLVPGLAVAVRRLHDIDRSGWWYLLNAWSFALLITGSVRQSVVQLFEGLPTGLGFVMILAMIACVVLLFVFMITPGSEGRNSYGPDPYGGNELEEVFA
jgi:uncharacterized membrane protein YhaH (DUF805 family)